MVGGKNDRDAQAEYLMKEPYLEIYYKLIEQGADLDKYDSNEKIAELAEEIFKKLMVL